MRFLSWLGMDGEDAAADIAKTCDDEPAKYTDQDRRSTTSVARQRKRVRVHAAVRVSALQWIVFVSLSSKRVVELATVCGNKVNT